jgi:hypothetical protein
MKFNKKASMQLSINMIVILIIAVVILGLALGFVQGMFGKMSKTFEGEAANEPDAPAASVNNLLTCSRTSGQIVVNPGEELAIKWGGYCNEDPSCEFSFDNTNIDCTNVVTTFTSTNRTITSGESDQITSKLVIAKDAATGTNLCTVETDALSDSTEYFDLTIKVVS